MIMSVWAKNRAIFAYLLVSCHIALLELCQIDHISDCEAPCDVTGQGLSFVVHGEFEPRHTEPPPHTQGGEGSLEGQCGCSLLHL